MTVGKPIGNSAGIWPYFITTIGPMSDNNIAAVILAAGRGTRMGSDLPKVLQPLAGKPMISHVLDSVAKLKPKLTVVVIGPNMDAVRSAVVPHQVVIQRDQRGTADAVKATRESLTDFTEGTVLILYGDTPLIQSDTLKLMIEARENGAAVVLSGFHPQDPSGYGRFIHNEKDELIGIVEDADLEESQRGINFCPSGIMAVEARNLMSLVNLITDNNAKNEFYLTDIVAVARTQGLDCAVVEADDMELTGVDSRVDLAAAEAHWQKVRRERAMVDGATLLAPETVWFSHDTTLGHDAIIGPNVLFALGVTLGDRVEIKAFCHLDGTNIADDATIGPFARLRPGTVVGAGSRIGNFVEVKNAVLGEGVRAGHLTYLGDTKIGQGANIGAGTITCNYDGVDKHNTVIGAGAFIGSNTALVAPVNIGNGAFIAAGSVITDDVTEDRLAIARGRQVEMPKQAAKIRNVEATTRDRVTDRSVNKTEEFDARKSNRRKPN